MQHWRLASNVQCVELSPGRFRFFAVLFDAVCEVRVTGDWSLVKLRRQNWRTRVLRVLSFEYTSTKVHKFQLRTSDLFASRNQQPATHNPQPTLETSQGTLPEKEFICIQL